MKEEKNATSEYIKAIIQERGLKQNAVAYKAGYSKQMFNYMLNNHRGIKDIDVLRIADALGVTPNELFGITTPEQK